MLKDYEQPVLSIVHDNSFNKYILNLYYEQGSVLDSWDKAVKNKTLAHALMEPTF